jgi:hypothetical protein
MNFQPFGVFVQALRNASLRLRGWPLISASMAARPVTSAVPTRRTLRSLQAALLYFVLPERREASHVALVSVSPEEWVEHRDLLSVLFWAGFAPSIWMWLYVGTLFVTRVLLRSEKLVNRLRWFLDIEKAPFRSIGAVAAALAFIASVAILLISAEVSRISTAA